MNDIEAGLLIANAKIKQLEQQLSESQRREKAAVELIGKVSQAVEVAFNATDYVKPNTGIWHTLGLALDWIKAWRGTQEAGKERRNESHPVQTYTRMV